MSFLRALGKEGKGMVGLCSERRMSSVGMETSCEALLRELQVLCFSFFLSLLVLFSCELPIFLFTFSFSVMFPTFVLSMVSCLLCMYCFMVNVAEIGAVFFFLQVYLKL